MAGLFFHQGYNYKTEKYDIGYLDNKECIKLKEMLNVSHITIKNYCPTYVGYFNNIFDINNNYIKNTQGAFITYLHVPGSLFVYHQLDENYIKSGDIIVSPILQYSPIALFCEKFLNKF